MRLRPAVSFFGPYRVYLPDEFLDVRTSAGLSRVKAVAAPADTIQGASKAHGQNIEIPHDIFGFGGRTQFYVILEDSAINSENPDWKQIIANMDRELVAKALEAVNRVLAVYRDQDISQLGEKSFHVIELIRRDISDIRLVMVTDADTIVDDFAIRFPGYQTMGFGEATARSPAVTASIKQMLSANDEIPIERELISSAKNHLWRRQLRLVAVEANTAFESFAFEVLREVDPTSSLPETSQIFDKLKSLEEVIATAAVQKKIPFSPWFNKAVDGWKGLLSPELISWHRDCYELRNKVIHRGFNNVKDDDATRALGSTEEAMAYLTQLRLQIVP